MQLQNGIFGPHGIHIGEAAQRHRRCLDHQIIDRKLIGAGTILGAPRIQISTDFQQRINFHISADIEMRDRRLGFGKAARNHLAHAAIRNGSMRRSDGNRRGGTWRRNRRGRGSRCSGRRRATRQRRIHIRLHNPPIGAGACDFADIQTSLGGHAARQRARENAITRCWCRCWRYSSGRRCRNRRGYRCRYGCRFRCSAGGGHGFARFHQHCDHIIHLHRLRAGGHQDAAQNALIHCFHFHRRLIGFDFRNHIAGLDPVTFLLQPTRQIAFRHRRRQSRHQDIRCHDLSPYRR